MKYLITLCLLCIFVLTGCSNYDGMFTPTSTNFDLMQPYSNKQGFLLANYDIKPVTSNSGVNILNEFDFSGPMNELYGQGTGSSGSTVIEPEAPVNTSMNSNLLFNKVTGLVAPLDVTNNTGSIAITSTFGPRPNKPTEEVSSYHKGLDIGAPSGTPVYAVASGTVVTASYNSSAGYHVVIAHDNTDNGIRSSVYYHSSKLLVSEGEYVKQGQEIMKVGSTGASTGPHLHIGLYNNDGNFVNPAKYLPEDWP